MAYLAFYRIFRPTSFGEVVRQEHIVRILKNQIESGKIGHAYLFCGPRGTGKTTLAKIFARAINCEDPQNGSPCGKCAACRALASGSNLDISEIDAASNNGVDEMRDLREKVQYPPVAGKYKVYIIDEVHMLTASAFNAVLKTLEEPPRHAVFILATTEPQKIPATILSRCMRFDFKLIPLKDLEALVSSVFDRTGKEYEKEAVSAIARAGAGSARDCLSIADMCASYSSGKLTYEDVAAVLGAADYLKVASLAETVLKEDAPAALSAVEEVLSTGKSVGVLVKDMLGALNDIAVAKLCKNAREIINLPEENFLRIKEIADAADGHKILRVTEILAAAESAMRYSSSGRITLETAVIKAAMPAEDYNIDALIGKIAELERKLESGKYALPSARSMPKVSAEPVLPQKKVPAAEPPVLEEESGESPFASGASEEKPAAREESGTQPTLWDDMPAQPPKSGLSEGDKRSVFAKFLKCLRTTHKNAVLFTLCMDLMAKFEGDKLVLATESEPVYKALVRADNYKFMGGVLSTLNVTDFEVRLQPKGESEFDKALKTLKDNFTGTDINVK